MLRQTSQRIENKMKQLFKFSEFLEEVRKENEDEFKEVLELTQRFRTLQNENTRLTAEQVRKEQRLNELVSLIESQRDK